MRMGCAWTLCAFLALFFLNASAAADKLQFEKIERDLPEAVTMLPGGQTSFLHDLHGDAALEWVLPTGDFGFQSREFSVYSLDPEMKELKKLGTFELPDFDQGSRRYPGNWGRLAKGGKEGLYHYDGAAMRFWRFEFDTGTLRDEVLFEELPEPGGADDGLPAFMPVYAPESGDLAFYVLNRKTQGLWRRNETGEWRRAALPAVPDESTAGRKDTFFVSETARNYHSYGDSALTERLLHYSSTENTHNREFQDLNFDGRLDFLWTAGERGKDRKIWASLQGENGSFQMEGREVSVPEFGALPHHAAKSGPLNFDGDNKADYAAMFSIGSLDDPRTTFAVQYGRWGETIGWDRQYAKIRTRDIGGVVWIGDIDGNGLDDVCAPTLNVMLSTPDELLGLFLKDEFEFSLRLYLGQTGTGLPDKPDGGIELRVKTAAFFDYGPPFDLSGDFNGDGARDLLVRRDEKTLELYLYDPERKDFHRKRDAEIDMPPGLCIVDANGDGLSDLYRVDSGKNELEAMLSKGGE